MTNLIRTAYRYFLLSYEIAERSYPSWPLRTHSMTTLEKNMSHFPDIYMRYLRLQHLLHHFDIGSYVQKVIKKWKGGPEVDFFCLTTHKYASSMRETGSDNLRFEILKDIYKNMTLIPKKCPPSLKMKGTVTILIISGWWEYKLVESKILTFTFATDLTLSGFSPSNLGRITNSISNTKDMC